MRKLRAALLLGFATASCASESADSLDETVALTVSEDPTAAFAACRYDVEFAVMDMKLRFPTLGDMRPQGEETRPWVSVETIYSSDPDYEGSAIAFVQGAFELESQLWSFRCLVDLIVDEEGRREWEVFSSPTIIAPIGTPNEEVGRDNGVRS